MIRTETPCLPRTFTVQVREGRPAAARRGGLGVLTVITLVWASMAGCAPGSGAGGNETGTGGASATGSGGVTPMTSSGGSSGTGGTAVASGGASGTGGTGGVEGTGGANATGGGGAGRGGSGSGGQQQASGGTMGSTGGAPSGTGGVAGGVGSGGSTTGGAGGAGGGADVAPCTTNEIAMCTGTSSIECHFGGAPGNYEVTVELGGPTAANTYVDAEAFRRMVAQTATTAGQTKRVSFVVNVRANESEPIRPNDSPGDQHTAGTPGLDVYFRGPSPKVTFICHKVAAERPTMIWLAGDSTVADQQFLPYATWGQHFPQHFFPPISVANYGDSGESSGSHLARAGLWGAIKAGMKAGDWVLVQFGHNDDSDAILRTNLGTFIRDAKAVNAIPVMVSPMSRATFSGTTLSAQHGTYPATFRQVAQENNVPFIDLTALSTTWLRMVGSTGWQPYFSNGTDRTHPNHAGADIVSVIVRDAVRAGIPELAKHLR